jgi:hypothetical protein
MMALANRPNRKASDADIIRLNSVGLSLSTIGDKLGCHPTTITLRLKGLNIEPADTRRSFMELIYEDLTPAQQEWLANQLGPKISIRDYIHNLIVEDFLASTN